MGSFIGLKLVIWPPFLIFEKKKKKKKQGKTRETKTPYPAHRSLTHFPPKLNPTTLRKSSPPTRPSKSSALTCASEKRDCMVIFSTSIRFLRELHCAFLPKKIATTSRNRPSSSYTVFAHINQSLFLVFFSIAHL